MRECVFNCVQKDITQEFFKREFPRPFHVHIRLCASWRCSDGIPRRCASLCQQLMRLVKRCATYKYPTSPLPSPFMAPFTELPVELLSSILKHLIRPHHLTLSCRINKDFYAFGIRFLYLHIHIASWHKNPKHRVGLFSGYSGRFARKKRQLTRFMMTRTARGIPDYFW